MADVACPLCCEVGRPGTLVLRQINAEEAVYVCNNSQCPYPVGISDSTVLNPVPELREDSSTPAENGKGLTFIKLCILHMFIAWFILYRYTRARCCK